MKLICSKNYVKFRLDANGNPPSQVCVWQAEMIKHSINFWKLNGQEGKHAISCLIHLFDRSDTIPPVIDQPLFSAHAESLLPEMLSAVSPNNRGFDDTARAGIFTVLGTFAQHRFGNSPDMELRIMEMVLHAVDDRSSEVRAVVIPALGNCAAVYWNCAITPTPLGDLFFRALGD